MVYILFGLDFHDGPIAWFGVFPAVPSESNSLAKIFERKGQVEQVLPTLDSLAGLGHHHGELLVACLHLGTRDEWMNLFADNN